MGDQESSGKRIRSGSSRRKNTFFHRWLREIFPTPEERWEKRKKRKRRKNPIKEYFKQLNARRAYNRHQRREKKRSQSRNKTSIKKEQKQRFADNSLIQFFRKKFKPESKPYYYYAETDQPKSEIQRQRKRLLHYGVNSTVIYLIAYFITYFTYQAVVMFVASRFGLNSVFFFYEVAFPAGNNSTLWSSFNIILITFSGPFICLVLGLYYLILKARKDHVKGLTKLLFLWMAFHSLNFFLGSFVAGVITLQGLGYVIGWMYLPTFMRFGGSILSLAAMGLIGFLNTKAFLESSNSMYWTQRNQRPILVLFGGILPWAFSVIFLFILKFPLVIPQHENIVQYDSILYVTMIFLIAPMMGNFMVKPEFDSTVRKAKGRRINYLYLLFLIMIIVTFRVGLDSGFSYFVFK